MEPIQDDIETVRGALKNVGRPPGPALAALDRLVAERDQRIEFLMLDRDNYAAQAGEHLHRLGALEAERDRLIQAVQRMNAEVIASGMTVADIADAVLLTKTAEEQG